MSILFRAPQQRATGDTPNNLIPPRAGSVSAGSVTVTADSAMRNSAVWACLRLRADLISTMPLNVYRNLPDGNTVIVPNNPPVLVTPDGKIGIEEWLYASQIELDRSGNAFGLITARDALGYPACIQLVPFAQVTVRQFSGVVTYRINGTVYTEDEVWHERQYPIAGSPVGLSPVAYAAYSVGGWQSAQAFMLSWFGSGAKPGAMLKNTGKTLNPAEAQIVKDRFRANVANGDVAVMGSDWEYEMISASANESGFLEYMNASVIDICRFFGVPADMIDGGASGSNITYANITQRNLQFLVMNLQPVLTRRERTFSRLLLPAPRFCQFDTDTTMLRLDPISKATYMAALINARLITPDEGRLMENREPYTEDDYAQFDRLFTKQTVSIKTDDPITPTSTPIVT